ncbi:YcjF family protein [Flexibacterium corallicola]|uniref:YcjF family protein n=1 Tax=Flexibacterium corallicola TaxID=3037259 RepID=UPI00286ECF76|nr:TIGR01620 family protein [Pseudovibrio sp. M1P-2-3]
MKTTPKKAASQGRAPAAFKLNETSIKIEELPPATSFESIDETGKPQSIAPEPEAKKSKWGHALAIGLSGLASLALGLAVDSLLRDLFSRYEWLGWVGVGLTVLTLIGICGFVIKEYRALSYLAHVDELKQGLGKAAYKNDQLQAQQNIQNLIKHYEQRPETAHGRGQLSAHLNEVIDGEDLIKLAEADLMAPLDARARIIVMESAKRVSVVTAVSPRALIDIAIVFYENVRVIGRISRLYGGKPGTLGFWRLARKVATHLAVTGGLAAGDSILEQFIGQGLAAKVSARLGEGLVNGFLTARVGLAAIHTCRPCPFTATKGPALSEFMSEIVKSSQKTPNKD